MTEPVERFADIIPDPIWMTKVKAWKTIIKGTCPFKAGAGGLYCLWVGQSCCYQRCPRRIFEEGQVDPKLTEQYLDNQVQNRMTSMDKTVENMKKTVQQCQHILKEIREEKEKIIA